MQRPGKVPERAIGPLLSSAALLDIFVVILISALLSEGLSDDLSRHIKALPDTFHTLAVFLVVLPIYWILTEAILGGRSFGRVVHGLTMCDPKGKPLGTVARSSRAIRKITCYGLTGLNPGTAPRYDRKCNVVWYSTMVPPEPRPMPRWQLQFVTGSQQGVKRSFGKFLRFAQTGEIRFGRDAAWSDVPLKDESLSARHASLILYGHNLYLRDGDGTRGSSNGTVLGNKPLLSGETRQIKTETEFSLAGLRIRILR